MTRLSPSASLAPPMPPDSATTRRLPQSPPALTGTDPLRARGSAPPPATPAADQARPRTSTAGRASSAWPISREAAAAISSANPVWVTRSARPNRSGRPRMSMSAGRPATPSATPTVPRRQARPQLSLMMTPSRLPKCAARRSHNAAADASGSAGSSSTGSDPVPGSTFERSTPAFAMTKPSRCSTISTPGRCRTTRRDSRRMTSTRRGSLSTSAARLCARGEGRTLARSTWRPSAFETIFCATTRTSPSAGTIAPCWQAAISRPARSSPGRISGTLRMAMSVTASDIAVAVGGQPGSCRALADMRQDISAELIHALSTKAHVKR